MISIDKNKWTNFLRDFHRKSIRFNAEEMKVISNLINKGNNIQKILLNLNYDNYIDFEKYAKKVIFYKQLQNDVINDLIQYEKDVIEFYKNANLKQGYNIWKMF